MARRNATFRKADMVRLIEAAKAAGLKVTGVEVAADGTLRALEIASEIGSETDFDRWEREL